MTTLPQIMSYVSIGPDWVTQPSYSQQRLLPSHPGKPTSRAEQLSSPSPQCLHVWIIAVKERPRADTVRRRLPGAVPLLIRRVQPDLLVGGVGGEAERHDGGGAEAAVGGDPTHEGDIQIRLDNRRALGESRQICLLWCFFMSQYFDFVWMFDFFLLD